MKRTQRGSIEIIAIILVLVLVAGFGATAVHTYNRAITENEALKDNNETLQQAAIDSAGEIGRLEGARDALDGITTTRKGNDIKKADIERMVNNALQTAYAKSPEARKWADTPVPADVLVSLHSTPIPVSGDAKDSARGTPTAVRRPDAGAGAAGAKTKPDERSAAGLRSPDGKPPR